MPSAPAIGFEYQPPRLLLHVILGVAALALLSIGLSGLPWPGKFLLAMAVLIASWRSTRKLRRAWIAAAGWNADEQWTVRLVSGDDAAATLVSFHVLGAFVLLRLRVTGLGVHVLLLGPDNSDGDIRRRLRMRLAIVQADAALPRM